MSIENLFENTIPEDQIRTQENPVGPKEKPEIKEEKEGQNTDEKDSVMISKTDTEIETKLDNKEDKIFDFSKEYLRKMFSDLRLLDNLQDTKNIDQHEINELLNYLTTEIFPYFKLTLEDEEKYKKEIENNTELNDNIKRIDTESFQKTRKFLLETFLEASVKGLEKNKGVAIIQNIEPLLILKTCLPTIQSRLEENYGTSNLLDLPEVLNKTLEDYKKRNDYRRFELPTIIETLEKCSILYKQLVIALREEALELDNLEVLETFRKDEPRQLLGQLARLLNDDIIVGQTKNPLDYMTYVDKKRTDENNVFILIPKVKHSEQYRKKYMRKFSKERVFNLLKQQSELVRKDNMFCTNRDFIGTKNIFKEGAILSTYELQNKGYFKNLKANAKYSQEMDFGFEEGTPLVYGTLVGGRQIPELNEWEIGGLPRSGTNYGDVFFLVNIDKLKNRLFCAPGSGGTESKELQFSIDHAYLIKAIINMEKGLKKEFFLEDRYLSTDVVGQIDLKDAKSINFFMGGKKSENEIEQQKEGIEDLKKQYPQFQDKIRIID